MPNPFCVTREPRKPIRPTEGSFSCPPFFPFLDQWDPTFLLLLLYVAAIARKGERERRLTFHPVRGRATFPRPFSPSSSLCRLFSAFPANACGERGGKPSQPAALAFSSRIHFTALFLPRLLNKTISVNISPSNLIPDFAITLQDVVGEQKPFRNEQEISTSSSPLLNSEHLLLKWSSRMQQ